jgi:hypothetical protein
MEQMKETATTREWGAGRLQRCVAGIAALEQRIEELLDRLRGYVRGHPGTAAAFERFLAVAQDHRHAVTSHLRSLEDRTPHAGGQTDHTGRAEAHPAPPAPARPADPTAAGAGDDRDDSVSTGPVSRALRTAYLALNDAAIGYGVLHEMAHLSDSLRFAATLRLAERHLRGYTAAAQEITQLLAEIVAWELQEDGQGCACPCPACSLGICWCIAHTTDTINQAWRETAPAYPAGGLRVTPNSRRPADLDVRDGDVVIAVDGHRVATTADVTAAVLSRALGQPITLGIERPSVGTLEIVATRR